MPSRALVPLMLKLVSKMKEDTPVRRLLKALENFFYGLFTNRY